MGFKRPFRAQDVRDVLYGAINIDQPDQNTALVDDKIKLFWLGKLKRTACLISEDDEVFKQLKSKIDGLVWPQDIGGKLQVLKVGSLELVSEIIKSEPQALDLFQCITEAQKQKLDEVINYEKPIKKIVIPPPSKEEAKETRQATVNRTVARIPQHTPYVDPKHQSSAPSIQKKSYENPLDKLFQKTTHSKPVLYFLANSDKIIADQKQDELDKIKHQTAKDLEERKQRIIKQLENKYRVGVESKSRENGGDSRKIERSRSRSQDRKRSPFKSRNERKNSQRSSSSERNDGRVQKRDNKQDEDKNYKKKPRQSDSRSISSAKQDQKQREKSKSS
eukprot:403359728